jgi:uncharacterized protein
MGSILCEHCTGHCCRYLALPIDKPATRRDFDDMRWYLAHQNVLIFVEDGAWYIQFTTPCQHLQSDNRCGIYETRPAICREYSTTGCDYRTGEFDYEHLFTRSEELEVFAKDYLKRKRARARRRKERQPSRQTVRLRVTGGPPAPLRPPASIAV